MRLLLCLSLPVTVFAALLTLHAISLLHRYRRIRNKSLRLPDTSRGVLHLASIEYRRHPISFKICPPPQILCRNYQMLRRLDIRIIQRQKQRQPAVNHRRSCMSALRTTPIVKMCHRLVHLRVPLVRSVRFQTSDPSHLRDPSRTRARRRRSR